MIGKDENVSEQKNESNPLITIRLDELDMRIEQDIRDVTETREHKESMKEKVEGWIFAGCLVCGVILLIIHAFTDWIPFLVGLPSARVIITRWLV